MDGAAHRFGALLHEVVELPEREVCLHVTVHLDLPMFIDHYILCTLAVLYHLEGIWKAQCTAQCHTIARSVQVQRPDNRHSDMLAMQLRSLQMSGW